MPLDYSVTSRYSLDMPNPTATATESARIHAAVVEHFECAGPTPASWTPSRVVERLSREGIVVTAAPIEMALTRYGYDWACERRDACAAERDAEGVEHYVAFMRLFEAHEAKLDAPPSLTTLATECVQCAGFAAHSWDLDDELAYCVEEHGIEVTRLELARAMVGCAIDLIEDEQLDGDNHHAQELYELRRLARALAGECRGIDRYETEWLREQEPDGCSGCKGGIGAACAECQERELPGLLRASVEATRKAVA